MQGKEGKADKEEGTEVRGGALLALILAALLIGGCGGGEEQGSTGKEATLDAEQKGSAIEEAKEAIEAGQKSKAKEPPPRSPVQREPQIAQERTPGSKAVAPGVPTAKGGDNSIQAFGLEGEEAEAIQAARALQEYLRARIAGDWQAACDAASQEFRDQLATLIERAKAKAKDAQKPQGCPETLSLLYGKAPSQALREAAAVNRVLSFRVREDGYAYLIYESETGEAKFIAMANEAGAWKVNATEPTGFPETEEQGSPQ